MASATQLYHSGLDIFTRLKFEKHLSQVNVLINIFTYSRFFFCLVSHMIDMRRAGFNFKHPHGMICWLQISPLISRWCTGYPKPPSMEANDARSLRGEGGFKNAVLCWLPPQRGMDQVFWGIWRGPGIGKLFKTADGTLRREDFRPAWIKLHWQVSKYWWISFTIK